MNETIDRLSPNQDDFYNALMDAHTGLDEAESHALNARQSVSRKGDHAGSRTSPVDEGNRYLTRPSMDTTASIPRPCTCVA